jgi:antitoxin component YwqK of YwqJK toxin-antitoxin module
VRLYYENGRLAEELHFRGGEKYGPWFKYFEDGAPKLQARHEAGGRLVVENAWDHDRQQVVKDGAGIYFDDGIELGWRYDVFFPVADWTSINELKDGVPHGTCRRYKKGTLWSEDHYAEGKRNGTSTLYWNNGRVRTVTRFDQDKEVSSEKFPKYDDPVPAVVLALEGEPFLYEARQHGPVDEYPQPLNLDVIRKRLKVPAFLNEIYQRNLDGTLKNDYEETGRVTNAFANGSGAYSGSEWGTYPPILKTLKFSPGRVRGKPVQCRVLARVDHTFVESIASTQADALSSSDRPGTAFTPAARDAAG